MQVIPIILTRPDGMNADFMAQIPAATANLLTPIESPLLRIEAVDASFEMLPSEIAIFTSSNGVRFAPSAKGRSALCVGMRTTQNAIDAGWDAACAGQTAAELIAFCKTHPPQGSLVHLSGVHVRGDIVQHLCELGLQARRLPLYDQVLLPISPEASAVLKQDNLVIVPLFSPRTAAHFAASCPPDSKVKLVTLSDAVTSAVRDNGNFDVITAAFPTTHALIGCIEKVARDVSLG